MLNTIRWVLVALSTLIYIFVLTNIDTKMIGIVYMAFTLSWSIWFLFIDNPIIKKSFKFSSLIIFGYLAIFLVINTYRLFTATTV